MRSNTKEYQINLRQMISQITVKKKGLANSYDQYLGAEVLLTDQKGEKLMGTVSQRIKYDAIITGEVHYNVIQEKSVYEVEYPDGTTQQPTANKIAENILSQVDYNGRHYQVLTRVTDKIYTLSLSPRWTVSSILLMGN